MFAGSGAELHKGGAPARKTGMTLILKRAGSETNRKGASKGKMENREEKDAKPNPPGMSGKGRKKFQKRR